MVNTKTEKNTKPKAENNNEIDPESSTTTFRPHSPLQEWNKESLFGSQLKEE